MKKRLQKLWDEVMPDSGPCPQPDVKKIQHRVNAALNGRPHSVPRRILRLAVAAAVAVLLLTGAVAASGVLELPLHNALSAFFWGENPENAIAMMTITPVSVEDDNYTMTATSSLADGNKLYFTLLIEAKNDAARERLQSTDFAGLLSFRIPGSHSYGFSGEIAPEDGVLHIDVSATWRAGKNASARLNLMDEGIWLDFPVKPVRSVTLNVDSDSQGIGREFTEGGLVTVDRVEISPLSYTLRYTASHLDTYPVPYFLFQDGSIRTMGQMKASEPSGGSDYGLFNQYPGRQKLSWQFGSVQDLSLMEAIVFDNMAYPLDGGEPYEVDVSAIPQPFVISLGEQTPEGDWFIPLFALCEGLGVDCRWDETAGVAVVSFRDTTVTFTVGDKAIQVDGQWNWNTTEVDAAPAYQNGELWVDAVALLRTAWSIHLDAAIGDRDSIQKTEDGSVIFTSWVVNP